MTAPDDHSDMLHLRRSKVERALFFCIGWLFFAIGIVGVFLPVLPTTPLMLLALWAFARSSERFHRWLLDHKIFGPPLRKWHHHRVIPLHAKIIAIAAMGCSLGYMVFFAEVPNLALITSVIFMSLGATYVLTKPSRVPVKK